MTNQNVCRGNLVPRVSPGGENEAAARGSRLDTQDISDSVQAKTDLLMDCIL